MQRNEELGCSNFSKDCPWLNKIREHFLQSDRDDVLEMMFERSVRWTSCPVRSAWFAKSKSEGYQERIVFFFLPLLLLLLLLLPLSPSPPPPYLLLRPRRPPPPPPAIPSAAGNPSRVRGLRNRWSFEIKLTRDAMSPWRNCVKTVRVPSPNCACSKLYRRNNYHEGFHAIPPRAHSISVYSEEISFMQQVTIVAKLPALASLWALLLGILPFDAVSPFRTLVVVVTGRLVGLPLGRPPSVPPSLPVVGPP